MLARAAQVVPVSGSSPVSSLSPEEEESKSSAAAPPIVLDDGHDSDKYEEGSDSDDSVDLGGLVLSRQHEEKKRRKAKRQQESAGNRKNFVQARHDLKEKIIAEVMREILPDIGQYDVTAPPVDTSGKKWYDPFIRLGKIFGLVTLTLHEAVLCGNENFLEKALEKVHQGKKSNRILLSAYDENGFTPLSLAAKTNQVSMAQMIVARHADPDVPDMMTGRTPLFYAARIPNHSLVRVLVSGGANPAFGDYKGVTPLMMAAFANDYRSVELMLSPRELKGTFFVEVDQQDDNGWTALHYGALGNSPKACRVLVKNGADRRLKDNNKRSPLQLAHYKDETDEKRQGQWGLCIAELEDYKAKLNG